MRLLLRSARVRSHVGLIDIVLDDGLVTAIGAGPTEADQIIDVDGRVVLPAFADLHVHLDKAGTAPLVDHHPSASGTTRLRSAAAAMQQVKAELDEEAIHTRAVDVVRRLVSLGTTALRTHVDVDTTIGLRGLSALEQVRADLADLVDLEIVVMPTEPGWHHGGPGMALVEQALHRDVRALGGATNFVPDSHRYAEVVLTLAQAHDVDVDLHVDETDDPEELVLEHVADLAVAHGYEGRVVAGHCSSLALASGEDARRIIDKVVDAGIAVVAMPMTNLYLLGGAGPVPGARGMTRLGDLLAADAAAVCASDNFQDPFMPYGHGDVLHAAALAGLVGHLGDPADQQRLLDAVTTVPRHIITGTDGAIAVGSRPDLVVLDSRAPERVLADLPRRDLVIRRGQVLDAR